MSFHLQIVARGQFHARQVPLGDHHGGRPSSRRAHQIGVRDEHGEASISHALIIRPANHPLPDALRMADAGDGSGLRAAESDLHT